MPQDAGECLGIHTAGQSVSGEGVSQIMKSDIRQSRLVQQCFQMHIGIMGRDRMLRFDRVMEDPLTQCVLLPSAQQVCRTPWQDDGAFSFACFGFAGAVFSLALIVQSS